MQMWILALGSVGLSAAGQLLIKYGLNLVRNTGSSLLFLTAALRNPAVVLGLGAYGAGALLWLLALRQTQLNQLYPVASLGYIAVAAGSAVFLGESVSPGRLAGLAVIVAGVVLVARS